MTVSKQSVAFKKHVLEKVKTVAAREGTSVSAWVNDAAEQRLRRALGRAAVAEWEAEHGAFSPLELARGDKILDRALGRRPKRRRSAR